MGVSVVGIPQSVDSYPVSSIDEDNAYVEAFEERLGDPFGELLVSVANHRLLTREEEISLARARDEGICAREELRTNSENMSDSDRELFIKKISKGNEALESLCVHNQRLILSVLRKEGYFRKDRVDIEDQFQEGNLGLMRAAKRFDPERGHKFSTYATWWIRQAITRGDQDKSSEIRVPVYMLNLLSKVNRFVYAFEMRFGEKPTPEQISDELEIRLEHVKTALSLPTTYSLNTPVGGDGGESELELQDTIPAPEVSPLDLIERDWLCKVVVEEILPLLNEREKTIITMKFGIGKESPVSYEDIGNRLKLTRARVGQIATRAMGKVSSTLKLSNPVVLEGIRAYLAE